MLDWSVLLPFLDIGFSFSTLKAFGKTLQEIYRLQRAETGFAKMSGTSFKNLPKSLSTPVALELNMGIWEYGSGTDPHHKSIRYIKGSLPTTWGCVPSKDG